MTTDSASLRLALVEDLGRRGLIRTPAVREAFLRVPRERFVPELASERGLAAIYRDDVLITLRDEHGVPISSSSQPAIMASMLENLQLASGQHVLEIGAGTGYNAALLAELAGEVVAVDVDGALAERAGGRLADGGHRVDVVVGDGMEGWAAGAPYDRIVVTATPPFVPRAWRDQLRPGGLLELPMPLGPEHAAAYLVVTFRREGAELVSVAMVPGGFMRFRGADGRAPAYPQGRLGWYDSLGRRSLGGSLNGPALARLATPARRRLLAALVSGPRRLATVRGAGVELFLHLVCSAPSHRLVATTQGEHLGLVDDRGNAALLRFRWQGVAQPGISALERYGDPGEAEPALRRLVEAWRAGGRPGLADHEVRVAFGRPPRGVTWRLPSRGEARIGVSVRPRPG